MDELGCTDAQAAIVVKQWLDSGLLLKVEYWDKNERKNKSGVQVVTARRPS
jgi:hypothetical protein